MNSDDSNSVPAARAAFISRSPRTNTANGGAGVDQADAAVEGQDQQAGHDPGEHHSGDQVAEQGDAQPLRAVLRSSARCSSYSRSKRWRRESAEAEGAQLLGQVLAGEQHVEVVAAALGLGAAVVEAGHRLAAPGRGHQQGHGRPQNQRHQPGLEGEQGQGDPGDADQGAGQADQPLDDLPGPELAAAGRPDQLVVEGRAVVGLQLDRQRRVDDPGLRRAGVSSARISRCGAARGKPSPAVTGVSSSSRGRTCSGPAPLRPAAITPSSTPLPSSRTTASPIPLTINLMARTTSSSRGPAARTSRKPASRHSPGSWRSDRLPSGD